MLSFLFPLHKQLDTGNVLEDEDTAFISITKAVKRPLGLHSDLESTLTILVNNNSSEASNTAEKTCPKLMASVLYQMALSRTSVDPKQQRPLGNVTILTTSAWPSRPKAMHGMPEPTFQSLSLISFVYIKDLNDLHKYLLILPKSAFAPDMIVLDESLEIFMDNQFKLSKVLALLRHLAECMRKRKIDRRRPPFQCIVAYSSSKLKVDDNQIGSFLPNSVVSMTKLHFFADEVWNITRIEEDSTTKELEEGEEEGRIAYRLTNMISEMHFDFSFCKEKDKFVMEKIWQENIVPLPDL